MQKGPDVYTPIEVIFEREKAEEAREEAKAAQDKAKENFRRRLAWLVASVLISLPLGIVTWWLFL